jgi:hypothetical protein
LGPAIKPLGAKFKIFSASYDHTAFAETLVPWIFDGRYRIDPGEFLLLVKKNR